MSDNTSATAHYRQLRCDFPPESAIGRSGQADSARMEIIQGSRYRSDLIRACNMGLITDIYGGDPRSVIFRDSTRFAHFRDMVLGEYSFNFYSDNNRRLGQTASLLWKSILASTTSPATGFDAGAGAGFTAYDMYEAGRMSGRPFRIETTGLSPVDPFIPPSLLGTERPLYESDLLDSPFIDQQYIGNFLKLDINAHSLTNRYAFINDDLGAVLYLLLNGSGNVFDMVADILAPGGIFHMSFLRTDMLDMLQTSTIPTISLVGLKAEPNGFQLALRKIGSSHSNTGIFHTEHLTDILL